MTKILKLSLCFVFLYTAACEEGFDASVDKILYPFIYSNVRATVPAVPPEGIEQTYLSATASNGEEMKIHTWYHHSNSETNQTLIYFHGNNENIGMLKKKGAFKRFQSLGLNFVVIDYPGLGRSTSFPNEYNLTNAGLAAVDFALDEFEGTDFILWGRSLGAGVASQVVPHVQQYLTGFILTSPWATFPKLAFERSRLANGISNDWFRQNTYDSVASARQVRVPSLVQHGKKDSVIPFKFGKEVYEAFPKGVAEFHVYPKLNHRNIFQREKVWRATESFLRSLR